MSTPSLGRIRTALPKGSGDTDSRGPSGSAAAPSGVFYGDPPPPLGPPSFYFIVFKIKSKKRWDGVRGGLLSCADDPGDSSSGVLFSVTPLWGEPQTQACHWAPREWVGEFAPEGRWGWAIGRVSPRVRTAIKAFIAPLAPLSSAAGH